MHVPRATASVLLFAMAACQDSTTAPGARPAQLQPLSLHTAPATGRVSIFAGGDAGSPQAQRVDAVTNVVVAMNQRLERVIAAAPQNPIVEPGPVADGFIAAYAAYSGLGQSVADVCAGVVSGSRTGDAIVDSDALAADMSATGIGNQLASIVTVLTNANDRLGAIFIPGAGPPEAPVAAALRALSQEVFAGGSAAAGWLGGAFDFPPNPCTGG